MKCPLCGFEFDENGLECRSSCCKDCNIVCCPNCKYQFPKESKLVNILKRLFIKRKV